MTMPRILFVDDEPNVLEGLRRLLRRLAPPWEMVFIDSPQQALALVEKQYFDVVMSDMRMPGMDGATLLTHVARIQPHTIRVVLTGYADQELAMKSVRVSHLYLNKPCEAARLIGLLKRLHLLFSFSLDLEQRQLMTTLTSLPVEPGLYRKLVVALNNPSSSVGDVANIVAQDLAVSSKLLQLVNSAYFGLPRTISDPRDAVGLLGLEIVKALVLGLGLFAQYQDLPIPGGEAFLQRISNQGLRVAKVARCIARTLELGKETVEMAFLAGLLHDLGKLVLMANFPDRYPREVTCEDETVPLMEERTLGIDHGVVGAFLAGLWGLPEAVMGAIAFHHAPLRAPDPAEPVLAAVHLACVLTADFSDPAGAIAEEFLTRSGLRNRLDDLVRTCLEKGNGH